MRDAELRDKSILPTDAEVLPGSADVRFYADLEAVSGGEAPVGIAGALIRGTGRVACEHRPRLPAREAHQIALGTTARQPIMGERVPELVG